MKNELTVINPIQFGLEESQANELTRDLTTIKKEREVLTEAYEDVMLLDINEENLPIFKALRLEIRNNRTKGIELWHKTNKAYFLAGGRFVDAIKNREIEINQRMEEKLLKAEKHFENLEKERLEKLNKERQIELSKYVEDVDNMKLSDMDNDVWEAYLITKKTKFEEAKAELERIEKERLEALRLEAERIEAQRIENEKLKLEAEKREKEIEAERKKQAEIKAKEEAKRKEVERVKAEKLAKEKAEQDAILEKEREAKRKLEAELKAKQEAEQLIIKEAKRKEEEEKARVLALAKASHKEQMKVWVSEFSIKDSPVKNSVSKDIEDKFKEFIKFAKNSIENI